MESYYDRSHSFSKNNIVFKVFFTYKYLNVETKHLKITSAKRTNIRKHFVVFSGAEKAFTLELFLTEYGELLIFLYLHSPTISKDEAILERRGSYTHKRHSFTWRYT